MGLYMLDLVYDIVIFILMNMIFEEYGDFYFDLYMCEFFWEVLEVDKVMRKCEKVYEELWMMLNEKLGWMFNLENKFFSELIIFEVILFRFFFVFWELYMIVKCIDEEGLLRGYFGVY